MYDNADELIQAIIKFIKQDDLYITVDWKEKLHHHGLKPWAFLSYAKKDLEENTDRGKINSLSNAKRAINCRVDEIIEVLKFQELSKNWGLPYKLEVLKSMNIVAPKILTDWINKRRNLLEHEYSLPDDVRYDIDVAELYLGATDKYVERGYVSQIILAEKGEIADESDESPLPKFHTILRYEYELHFPPLWSPFRNRITTNYRLLAIPKGIDPINDRKKRLKYDIVDSDTHQIKFNEINQNDLKEIMRYIWEREFKS